MGSTVRLWCSSVIRLVVHAGHKMFAVLPGIHSVQVVSTEIDVGAGGNRLLVYSDGDVIGQLEGVWGYEVATLWDERAGERFRPLDGSSKSCVYLHDNSKFHMHSLVVADVHSSYDPIEHWEFWVHQ